MTPPTTAPIRIRAVLRDGVAEVRMLMPHPMETGLRSDAQGSLVPSHHITEVTARVGARVVFSAQLGFAVARDPLFAFRFSGARAGDRLRVSWADNRGGTRSEEALIA